MTAADRPTVPRVGDTLTTAEQLDALPDGVIVMLPTSKVPAVRFEDVWFVPGFEEGQPSSGLRLPTTVLYVPGEQPAAGRAETTTATDEDVLDSLPYFTFEDDDVYPDEEFVRKADVARLLATARAETTTATVEDIQTLDARWFERWETEQPLADKYAGYYQGRVSAVAQCREELRRLLATARTVNVHPTYTVEYQQKIADELGVEREAVLRALGLAAPLLATARTRPTREELAEAIMDSDTIPCDVCDDSRCYYCAADAYRKADAVLALLADQPDPADVWDEAVEKIREQHPACEDPCEMCAEMDDWLTALADNPYRGGA